MHITKGYSKDNASELNQVVAQLICANKTSIPLWLEVLSGNTNDKKSFKATVKEFQKQFERNKMPYLVMDDEQAIRETEGRKGMFVIATNELDESALSDEQLLCAYKDQGFSVERGFRFLKDPWFYAESLYLKKPERIMALIMVMTLSLLVYKYNKIM